MSENYVKFKTNIEWYEMKTLIYLTVYECLVAFLQKIVDGKTWGDPIMSKELAEELGATYVIDDQEPIVYPNPNYGKEHFSFDGLDEDGNVLSTNLGIDTAKTHTTVPFGPDTAIANLGTALESLISEYDACEFDEYGAWFERASKVVPFLWD